MIKTTVTLFCFLLVVCSCNIVTRHKRKTDGLQGHWINTTLIQQIKDPVSGYNTDWIFAEMIFNGKDSVTVSNGFEAPYNLFYKKLPKNKGYLISYSNDRKDLDMHFTIEGTQLTIKDSFRGKPIAIHFIHASEDTGVSNAFALALNDSVIAGNYFLYKNNKPTEQKITFLGNGTIAGLDSIRRYEICYSGDCLEEPEKIANVIFLSDSTRNTTGDYYTWKKDYHTKRLHINKLATPEKDTKGNRKETGTAFELGW